MHPDQLSRHTLRKGLLKDLLILHICYKIETRHHSLNRSAVWEIDYSNQRPNKCSMSLKQAYFDRDIPSTNPLKSQKHHLVILIVHADILHSEVYSTGHRAMMLCPFHRSIEILYPMNLSLPNFSGNSE